MPRRQPERVTPTLAGIQFCRMPDSKTRRMLPVRNLRSSELVLDAVARSRAGETDPLALSVALLFGPDIFWTLKDNLWPDSHIWTPKKRGEKGPQSRPLHKSKSDEIWPTWLIHGLT